MRGEGTAGRIGFIPPLERLPWTNHLALPWSIISPPWTTHAWSAPKRDQHATPIGLTLLPTDTVEVIDPGHPLYGLTLSLIGITKKQCVGNACVVWTQPGIERIAPLAATSLARGIVPQSSCRVSVEAIRRLLHVVATIPELHVEDIDVTPAPHPRAYA